MKVQERSGVRVRVGGTAGSAVLVKSAGSVHWFLTNAHVVGTQIGRTVTLDFVSDSGDEVSASGQVVAAGFVRGQSIDWAVVRVSAPLPVAVDVHPLVDPVNAAGWLTVGSPRAERPSVRRLGRAELRGAVYYASPAAIGGQSGSGAGGPAGTHGLITWTDGRRTLMQSVSALRRTMSAEYFGRAEPERPCAAGFELPADAVPVCDGDPQPCESGFFGDQVQCAALWDGVERVTDWLVVIGELLPLLVELLRALRSRDEDAIDDCIDALSLRVR